MAIYLVCQGYSSRHRILCCREIQKSIKDSGIKLLDDVIDSLGMREFYRSTDTGIVCAHGTEFMFAGLRHNVETIKSMEGVTICWVEEAQTISRDSLEVSKPTIRVEGSIFLFTMNPRFEDDPAYEDSLGPAAEVRSDAQVLQMNHGDNPWFSDVLRQDMEHVSAHELRSLSPCLGGQDPCRWRCPVVRQECPL